MMSRDAAEYAKNMKIALAKFWQAHRQGQEALAERALNQATVLSETLLKQRSIEEMLSDGEYQELMTSLEAALGASGRKSY